MKIKPLFLILMALLLLMLPALACGPLGGEQATNTPAATDTPAATNTPAPTNTPEATATPDFAANFTTFTSDVNGITFGYPQDWTVDDAFFITAASDPALLGDTDIREGGIFVIIAGDSSEFTSTDPAAALTEAIADFELGEDQSVVSGPTATQIQGQDAAIATINGTGDDGIPFVAIAAVIFNGNRAAVAIGATPAATEKEFLPVLEAMINTIQVSQPTVTATPFLPTDITPVPSGEVIPAAVGNTYTGVVPQDGQVRYSLQLVANTAITLILDTSELDAVLEILDGQTGSIVAEVDDTITGSEVLVFTPQADGQYLVNVRGFAGAGGDFTLTINEGGSGVSGETIPLAVGEFYADTLAGNEHTFVFPGVAGVTTTLVLVPTDENLDATLAIYDSNGGVIVEVDSGFSGEAEVIPFQPNIDGDYYARVAGFAGGSGSYFIAIPDPAVALVNESGNVPNDQFASYTFFVPAGETLLVVVDPSEEFDAVLDVYDAGGTSLSSLDDGLSGEPEVLAFTPTADGDYEVRISGFVGFGGNFTILATSLVIE
ncbi:MAG: pre-peptidase C-terminal domain-containing protein [Chloroflexi bacterium]|nr:pre-peptidase C-terminal domain-containing protein [Chloroflexota bacterium]MCI0576073.1 pre-peptidase C-terminal domain-containing protein [Chloroflexota bacterium]MCI0647861.1 pre-peptidase C-terminal domain-containing protein [Chloroflexota bacterium]MCI0727112.1 pre-peptidase C-terminal domain-containing protein [Chloroflexota bacterium]